MAASAPMDGLDNVLYIVQVLSDIVKHMRDGIYKGLKLGRRWSTLLRRCQREADRGSRTESAALAALEGDFRRDVSWATVRELSSVGTSAASLLPGFSPPRRVLQPGGRRLAGRTPFEDVVWRHFHRVISTGVRGEDAVHNGLRDALREWSTRRFRHVQEHYLTEAGNEAREVLDAAEGALKAVDCDEIAARLIRKEKAPRRERRQIDLDEDLLGR